MELITNTTDGYRLSCKEIPPSDVVFGESPEMRQIRHAVEKLVGSYAPMLIQGEKGSGKEVLAAYIHQRQSGPSAPFLRVNPPIPKGDSLSDSASSADGSPIGSAELTSLESRCATLFVKDAADLDMDLQRELLELIQGSRSFLVGTLAEGRPLKLRIVCATSRDLQHEMNSGRFRKDLFAALNPTKLQLPPLRERRQDVPLIAKYLWELENRRLRFQSAPLSPQWVAALQAYEWPGNISELEAVVQRYVVLGSEDISSGHQPAQQEGLAGLEASVSPVSLKKLTREATQALERKIIMRTLQQTQWNRKLAARALKISYRALLYKIKEAGLPPKRHSRQNPKQEQPQTSKGDRAPTQNAAA